MQEVRLDNGITNPGFAPEIFELDALHHRISTQRSSTLTAKATLPHTTEFRALCGANLVT